MDAEQLLALGERVATGVAKQSLVHGPSHWAHVAELGTTLCKLVGEHRVSEKVVLAFAYLHDSQRENDGKDPRHGERAAAVAQNLYETELNFLNYNDRATLHTALSIHNKNVLSSNPTIAVCLDADRLTLWRVGKTPSLAYLSTVHYGYVLPSLAEKLRTKSYETLLAKAS